MIIDGQKVNPNNVILGMVKTSCKGCSLEVHIFPTDQKSIEEFYCSSCTKINKRNNETFLGQSNVEPKSSESNQNTEEIFLKGESAE